MNDSYKLSLLEQKLMSYFKEKGLTIHYINFVDIDNLYLTVSEKFPFIDESNENLFAFMDYCFFKRLKILDEAQLKDSLRNFLEARYDNMSLMIDHSVVDPSDIFAIFEDVYGDLYSYKKLEKIVRRFYYECLRINYDFSEIIEEICKDKELHKFLGW